MWRGHQAVQSSMQRWLPRLRHGTFVGTKRYSSRYRSCAVSYAAAEKILFRQPSIPSAAFPLLERQRDVSAHNQFFSTRRPRAPMMRDLHSVEEVISTAYDYLDVMSRRDISAVWARIALLMTKHQPKQRGNALQNRGDVSFEDMEYMLYTIFDDTTNGLGDCNMRELTETTLGMAKIVTVLQQQRTRRGEDSSRVILRRLLLDNNGVNANRELFQFLAEKAKDELHRIEARHLSNFAYAYALIKYVPEFDDGSDLFDYIGTEAVAIKTEFKPQELSNILWAYATVNKPQHALFEAMGSEICALKHLNDFKPQALANTVWAYATANERHPKLFEKVANHIVETDSLDQFDPQALKDTVWAYATAGADHPKLFEKVATHIVQSDSLDRFNPQALSNTVWAYATADIRHPKLFEMVANHIVKSNSLDQFVHPQDFSNTVWAYATVDARHPKLFEKMANHIVKSDRLDRFNPQALSNTVWAYATAEVHYPKLFQKVANHIVKSDSLDRFKPQELSNIVWAYATLGVIDRQLFSFFAATAAKNIDSSNNQALANIAWSFAIADVDAPTLFNDHFIHMCVQKKDGFNTENLTQLYQWHLWHTKEKSRDGLPEELLDGCYNAFISADTTFSKFQNDVVTHLTSIDLDPKEEVLLDSGYSIDAVVEVNGKTVGIEVDGPFHFVGRSKSPTGSTLLKRRQVPSIDGVELTSVPFWEWNKFGKDETKKQEYLRKLLGMRS